MFYYPDLSESFKQKENRLALEKDVKQFKKHKETCLKNRRKRKSKHK